MPLHLRHYGALALLALPTLSLAQATPPLIDGRQLVKEGIELHDKDKYEEAAARYQLVLPGDSAYENAQAELALSLLSADKYAESIAAAQRSKARNAFEPELYNTLASDYEGLKQPAEARQAYKDGLKLFPYSELLWVNQGIFELNQHDMAASLASLQRAVELRPGKASGHRLLGSAAIRQGQTAHAMLGWLLFLAIEPDGPRSHDVLVDLERLAQGVLTVDKEDQAAPVAPNAAFEELDQLITSKVALNAAYTSKVKFNAAIVKQIQLLVEKFPVDADPASDFWVRAYAPVIRVLRQGDNLTTFTYLILSSADDKGGQQWIKSNKSKLDKLAADVSGPLLSLHDQQPLPGGGRAAAWYDGPRLQGLGPGQRDAKGDLKPSGDWVIIAKDGSVRQRGTFTAEGKRTGLWRITQPDGSLEEEQTYANGELEGPLRYYYPGGQLRSEATYRNGKAEGPSKLYAEGGELRQTRQFANGDYEGEAADYFASGTPSFRVKMHADKKDGLLEEFYADGTLRQRATYAQDKEQGEATFYYADKTLEKKATYDQGELNGLFTSYFANGKTQATGQYTKGKRTGAWKEYYASGQPSVDETYDATGELHGSYLDYDRQGRHFSTTQYEHGRIVRLTNFDAAGQVTHDTPIKKGRTPMQAYDLDNHLRSTGSVENGHLVGEWKTLYADGTLREVQQYDAKGDLTGTAETYYPNGQLHQRRHYAPGGVAEGYFEQYAADGVLTQTGYQRQGQEQGVWKTYYATGQLSQENEYFHGDLSGVARAFTPGGKLADRRRYEFGQLREFVAYDSTGAVLDRFDLKPATREIVLHYAGPGHQVLNKAGFRSGHYEGASTWLLPGGQPESEMTLHRGRRYGRYLSHYPGGRVHTEGQYLAGERYGQFTTNYPDGTPSSQGRYLADEPVGEWTYYFPNGKVERVMRYDDQGELEGPYLIYNPAGELLIRRIYSHGTLMGYLPGTAAPDAAPQLLPAATGPVATAFANGKPALTQSYRQGYPDAPAVYYYSTGQVFRRVQYLKGMLSGPLVSYWPSGKLMEEESYLHDELHGRCRYYRPDGTLEREETYRAGERVGPSVSYDAQGRKARSEYYWNNAIYNPQ